ncbi:coiled-coil domain-containing protein 15 [Colius striatus]|uniref:coiled-coil domain-containing protein 15 n=1 Tax=Colius striatus TaxID=57412 RepID=UPI002B1E15AB|nr:coiled-coil domain-containing protein 15 [Colius striatus]
MQPPSKERARRAGEAPRGPRARPPRQSWRVLAERNPSVAPVGAWVESGPRELEESQAFASAFRVEEELKEQQREKAANLQRFQGEVQQRVNQQVRMRRKQQLQQSYEAAERERDVAVRYSDSILRLTPRKNTCLFRSHPTPLICSPCSAQHQGLPGEPFQQQAAELSRTMQQVRHRLASCKTMSQGEGPPELPGGLWKREKAESCQTAEVPAEGEELLLLGHDDLPAELRDQAEHGHDFYIKMAFEKYCDGSVKDWSLPEPPQNPHTDYQAPLLLWAGVDQEETKKQDQGQEGAAALGGRAEDARGG